MTIILILAAIVVLARWGGLLFFAYACWHLCTGGWLEAIIALTIACFIEVARSLGAWLDWNVSGRAQQPQHRVRFRRRF